MKRLSVLLAFLLPLAVSAAPVTSEQARTAVGNWLGTRPALGCRLGAAVDAVRTCAPTNGVKFHVVQLAGGGFVVTSSDTRIEPVVAFSDSDDLRESDDNPLWSLLKGDFAARTKALAASGGASLQSVAPGGAAQPTAAETRWAKLLKGGASLQSETEVSDVRVEPLVRAKWGQSQNSIYSNYGGPCYNYYTPNNYVCGCVATALAQLLRHHRYPENPKTVATKTCAVDGVQASYTMMGGPYDYDAMPLVPEAWTRASWYAGGATEAQRQAIGRLTYDCGVAMQMDWGSGGSGSGGAAAHGPLKNIFGYKCAHTTTAGLSDAAYRDRILRTNLDAGYPVLLGIDGPYGGHEILADGYGFSSYVLYTHLNMGWSGTDNAWYALPDIGTNYQFNEVTHAVFNIMPDKSGEIVSGRVVTADGVPVEGATVSVKRNGYSAMTTATDAHGIYAFVVASPSYSTTYTVAASYGGATSSSASVTVKATKDSSVTLQVGQYSYYPNAAAPTCGNVLCGDLVLSNLPVVASPVFAPADCSFYPETNVTITCATAGATVHYTLDGTDPTEASDVYTSPIRVTADTTIKARAYKSGSAASSVVAAVYSYVLPASKGDDYADAIAISEASGTFVVPDNSAYTLESGEPRHTLNNGSYYNQAKSIWFRWTAPGSGTMTFTADCRLKSDSTTYLRNCIVAIYVGDTLATATRLAYTSPPTSGASVSFAAEQGRTYRIVAAVASDSSTGTYTLSWTGSLAAAPTETSTTDVPVPYAWLDAAFPGTRTEAQYEALALTDSDGDGFPNWQEYLCGTDPTAAAELPQCAISMADGAPVVTHTVVVPAAAGAAGWTAVLKGSDDLKTWSTVPASATSGKRFFKVVVEKH